MKTHVLGSATAGHGDSLNWTSLVEFFKLSWFWHIYIKITNIQWQKRIKRYLKANFYIFTTGIGPLPFLPESPSCVPALLCYANMFGKGLVHSRYQKLWHVSLTCWYPNQPSHPNYPNHPNHYYHPNHPNSLANSNFLRYSNHPVILNCVKIPNLLVTYTVI